MGIRLMHLADLHLGAPFAYLGPKAAERAKDLESAFSRALSAACEKNVNAVLIAGDLFDRFNPSPDLVARVKSAFEKSARENIPVILLPGTHDSHRYPRCVYLREHFPGVDILLEIGKPLTKVIRNQPVHFYGFSGALHQPAGSFKRTEEEGLHIALVHGTVTDNEQWAAASRDYPLRREDIEKSGFHYIALGHHHNFKEFRYGATAVYPGTLEGLKFGENGDRYLVVAEVRESGVVVEKSRFNQKLLKEVEINPALEGMTCCGTLEAAIRNHSDGALIVKVTMKGSCDFLPAKAELEAKLAGDFFYLQIEDEISVFDSELIRRAQNDRTVQGIFIRKLLRKMEQAPPEQRASLELALRLTVEQFQEAHHATERA